MINAEEATCLFEAMFDTVSVAPDNSDQFKTIVVRKRQKLPGRLKVKNRVEQVAMCSTQLPVKAGEGPAFYAVACYLLRRARVRPPVYAVTDQCVLRGSLLSARGRPSTRSPGSEAYYAVAIFDKFWL